MVNNAKEKTLFELNPDLERKLVEVRELAKRLGLLGKFELT